MPETRRRFDPEFRDGAVRIVRETGKPIVVVARVGINDGKLGNWSRRTARPAARPEGPGTDERAELNQLRSEVAELRMERGVLT